LAFVDRAAHQLADGFPGGDTRREELRQGGILPGDISLRGPRHVARTSSNVGRFRQRYPVLYHPDVATPADTDDLVQRDRAMFLLVDRLLRCRRHVRLAQQVPARCVSVSRRSPFTLALSAICSAMEFQVLDDQRTALINIVVREYSFAWSIRNSNPSPSPSYTFLSFFSLS